MDIDLLNPDVKEDASSFVGCVPQRHRGLSEMLCQERSKHKLKRMIQSPTRGMTCGDERRLQFPHFRFTDLDGLGLQGTASSWT